MLLFLYMSVKERIKKYIESKNISIREFERNTKLNYGYINAIRVSIQPDKLKSIASYYQDLNTEWLLTGEGNMLKSTEQQSESQQDLIERLISIIESQQRTIELLTKK